MVNLLSSVIPSRPPRWQLQMLAVGGWIHKLDRPIDVQFVIEHYIYVSEA